MDFFDKLDELHANEVTPRTFKKEWGVSQEEVLQNVMDFVDKFDAEQERLSEGTISKQVDIKLTAEPLVPAAKPFTKRYKFVMSPKAAKTVARPAVKYAAKVARMLARAKGRNLFQALAKKKAEKELLTEATIQLKDVQLKGVKTSAKVDVSKIERLDKKGLTKKVKIVKGKGGKK